MGLTWPFVGRVGELQLIRDALTTGTGIVLAGAPGVGKTRLAREAIGQADPRRYLGLWVAATSATTPVPLGAFAPLLPAELRGGPVSLLREVTRALLERSGTRRLVLGIDDAHLLDEVSAVLVHQLARTRAAFVLAGLQSRCAVPDPIRALWKDALADRVEVPALSQAETADVLSAALGGQVEGVTGRRLWQAAQGNLSFLRELVESGVEHGVLSEIAGVWRWDGPWITTPRLVDVISARIGRLEPGERDVLQIVAFGEPIGADLLMSLADRRTVEVLESRNLLRARQEGRRVDVALAHPLYGDVLRAGCPPQRAAAVRRALADTVEATGARREDDGLRIAGWRLDARAPLRPDLVLAAARRAFALLDLSLAERLARTAFELSADPAAGAVLWRVLFLSHRFTEAEAVLARLAGTPAPQDRRGEWAIGRACTLFWGLHQVDEAFAVLRETRGSVDDPVRRDEMDLLECVFHLMLADVGPARRGLADLGARPGLSPRTAAQLPVAHGMALVHQGRLAPARDVLETATGPIHGCVDAIPRIAEARWMYRCHAALFAGLFAEAAEVAATLYTHAAQPEWDLALQLSCILQAQVARLRGRVRTAARWAREGHRRHVHLPTAPLRPCLLGELAHAEALAGHAEPAVAALTEADGGPVPSETHVQPWIELARPWVAVAAGDLARAVRLVTAESASGPAAAGVVAFGLHDMVRLGAADPVLHQLCELATKIDSALVRAFADHAVAAVNADPGGLEAVGMAFAGLGADLLAAEAYAQAAHDYRRRGMAASDRRLRAQAALLLDGCEGARTPLVRDVAAPQLTARERDIARLAAEGWANQEIAERMVISTRTVGNHLYHVYAKLGISGRSALAALLPPLGPPG